jgi:hypothetical protein
MKRWLIPAAIVAGVIVSAGPAAAAPPEPVDVSFPNDDCGFTVVIDVVGKTKIIDLGDGQSIITSPGQKATLTANGKTVKYVITGTSHEQVMEDGSTEVTATGRNILLRPDFGLFLTIGNFNYARTAGGGELRPFEGSGQFVNICEILSAN